MSAPSVLFTLLPGDVVRVSTPFYGPAIPEDVLGIVEEIIGDPNNATAVAMVRVPSYPTPLAFHGNEITPAEPEIGDTVRVIDDETTFYVRPAARAPGVLGAVMEEFLPGAGAHTLYVVTFDGLVDDASGPLKWQVVFARDLRVVAEDYTDTEDEIEDDDTSVDYTEGDAEFTEFVKQVFGGDALLDDPEDEDGLPCPLCGEKHPVNDEPLGEGDVVRYWGPREHLVNAVGVVFRDPKPGEDFLLIQWSASAPEDMDNGRYRAEDFIRLSETGFLPGDKVGFAAPGGSVIEGLVISADGADPGTTPVALELEDGGVQRVIVPSWTVGLKRRADESFPRYVEEALGESLNERIFQWTHHSDN